MFINTGAGFGGKIEEPMYCPPLMLSWDTAIPLGGLPFTTGLITGYFSEASGTFHYWPIAARIAYHPNFNVPRLDTYVVLTFGAIISPNNAKQKAYFWPGISIGARYFFLPELGAYIELGFDKVQNITFGLSFRI